MVIITYQLIFLTNVQYVRMVICVAKVENIFLMCLTGKCAECKSRLSRVEIAKLVDDDPRKHQAIFSRDSRNVDYRNYSLTEALHLLDTRQVKEGDILFPILIDIVANDGEVS